MGRPLKGSVRRRGNRWLASVPRRRGAATRLETSFSTESAAQDWRKRQLKRLEQGLDAVAPDRMKRPAGLPPAVRNRASAFIDMALDWFEERYGEMEKAGAERARNTRRDIELHLAGAFVDLFELDVVQGRQLIKDWMRLMAGHEASGSCALVAPGRTYSAKTVTGLLWILKEVIAHARLLGLDIPDYLGGSNISAMAPVGRTKARARLVTLAEMVQIAAGLHVIHQTVLFLIRLAGLRISEAYGVLVEDFIVDEDGDGYLVIAAMGGRSFEVRDDGEGSTTTTRVEHLKTDAGYRMVPLPRQLAEEINGIIAVYHTDDDGRIDVEARLIPTIRSQGGGQAGFRSALQNALGVNDDDPAALEDRLRPHDMRKSLATDLAWSDEVSDLQARRVIGHRAGTDVFSLVYVLDSRLKEHLAPVANALTAEIDKVAATLRIPTGLRPVYGADLDMTEVDARLEAMGWQVPTGADSIGVSDAAAILGMSDTATRRLMGTTIEAVKIRGGWRTTIDAVEAFKNRHAGMVLLPDLAAELGVTYHVAYRELQRLRLDAAHDPHDPRVLMLDSRQAGAIRDAVLAIRALNDRSAKLGEAAKILGVAHSTVCKWIDAGQLDVDPDTDATGARFITRASIQAKRETMGHRRKGVSLRAFMSTTDFDRPAVDALTARGILVRTRSGDLSEDSVRSWVTGHRPDLLDAGLF